MLTLTLLAVCAGGALTSSVRPSGTKLIFLEEEAGRYFDEFMLKYHRQYADGDQKQYRYEIFKENLKRINEMNMEDENVEYGITPFTDLTHEEFIQKFTGVLPSANSSETWRINGVRACNTENMRHFDMASVPDSFDWRTKNVVTRVKNQGFCGSCWAFSSTGNIESQYAIKHKKLLELSEQQLMDCDKNNHGCQGGSMSLSFGGLVDIGGIMTEKDYPYEAAQNICRFDKRKVAVKLIGCTAYNLYDEEKLKALLYHQGPISLGICTEKCYPNMQYYNRGIVTSCRHGEIDHAVLLVGYGTENNKPYWIIKNSWSDSWGEDGYIRLLRGINSCSMMNPMASKSIVA